jgi:hypothetical protein
MHHLQPARCAKVARDNTIHTYITCDDVVCVIFNFALSLCGMTKLCCRGWNGALHADCAYVNYSVHPFSTWVSELCLSGPRTHSRRRAARSSRDKKTQRAHFWAAEASGRKIIWRQGEWESERECEVCVFAEVKWPESNFESLCGRRIRNEDFLSASWEWCT